METALLLACMAIPLWLNGKATVLVFRDQDCEGKQKLAQLALVWLLPFLGGMLVLGIHRPAEAPSRRCREAPDPIDDIALPGILHRVISTAQIARGRDSGMP